MHLTDDVQKLVNALWNYFLSVVLSPEASADEKISRSPYRLLITVVTELN
jgi:hypothetical protein